MYVYELLTQGPSGSLVIAIKTKVKYNIPTAARSFFPFLKRCILVVVLTNRNDGVAATKTNVFYLPIYNMSRPRKAIVR
jgi:hypothetical protein